MQQILLVEDEISLQSLMALNLRQEGYEVVACSSAEETFKVYIPGKFSLAILDVMLPGMEGFELCERLKLMDPALRVMFVSARGEISDRVKGLKTGADDYLPKPFDLEEFLLRIEKLLVRSNTSAVDEHTIGAVTVNLAAHEAYCNDEVYTMNRREAMLLRHLINRKGQTVNRNEILEMVWGDLGAANPRMVDNSIVALRKILRDDSRQPKYLQSLRGVGYKLDY